MVPFSHFVFFETGYLLLPRQIPFRPLSPTLHGMRPSGMLYWGCSKKKVVTAHMQIDAWIFFASWTAIAVCACVPGHHAHVRKMFCLYGFGLLPIASVVLRKNVW